MKIEYGPAYRLWAARSALKRGFYRLRYELPAALLGRDMPPKHRRRVQTYYLAWFMEFLCNFKCSYCVQSQDEIIRTRYKRIDVDRVITYLKTEGAKREKVLALIGGEVTINKHFPRVIEELCRVFHIILTTNIGSPFFEDFPRFLSWAREHPIQWNTSFHPEFMEADEYIRRIRAMREAGLLVDQVAAVESPALTPEALARLKAADIGFYLQPYQGFDPATGELLPKHLDHPAFDYGRYQAMCGKADAPRRCLCRTVSSNRLARHLIAPDGRIYTCHHLLYNQLHPIGHVDQGWPAGLLDPIECTQLGRCNTCDALDMQVVKVLD